MCVAFNPKDSNTFASASLDKTIKVFLFIVNTPELNHSFLKVWNLGSSTPNYTLEGHEKGVNWVDYYYGGEKPYLVSAADDRYVANMECFLPISSFPIAPRKSGIIRTRRAFLLWKVIRRMCVSRVSILNFL